MSLKNRAKSIARRSPTFMQLYRQRDAPACAGAVRIDMAGMQAVIEDNRRLIRDFGDWIDPDAMRRSTFNYGLSMEWMSAIQLPTSRKMTYSDLLAYFAADASGAVSYLEIGVSVGKNFWQLLNRVSGGSLVALDIEDINPPLARRLEHVSSEAVDTSFKSRRERPPRRDRYTFPSHRNDVEYHAGDVFDPAVWRGLEGRKFNLIFSDAFHDPDAVLFEWKQLVDLKLIDERGFSMIWDDLVSKQIRQVFNDIATDCVRRFGLSRRNACLTHVAGWVGEYEDAHPIGVVSSQGFVS